MAGATKGDMTVREIAKALLPASWLHALRRFRAGRSEYRHQTVQQVFTSVYERKLWGSSGDPADKFFSGSGSRNDEVASVYVSAMQSFLADFRDKPDVVDLGCGDFYVGAQIRPWCGAYTACDIVAPLIAYNRQVYKDLGVDFQTLDLTTDALPRGDILFLRQVLQHLSNEQIRQAIRKIVATYKLLVVTEHLPLGRDFTPNLDKPHGPDIRLFFNSGVVLTSPPFSLPVYGQRVLCEVPELGGIVRTTLYQLVPNGIASTSA